MAATLARMAPEALASVAALLFALIVWRLGRGHSNGPLLALLLLDGIDQTAWMLSDAFSGRPAIADIFIGLGVLFFTATVLPYLLLLRGLATPFAAPLRDVRRVWALGIAAMIVGALPSLWIATHSSQFTLNSFPPQIFGLIVVAAATVGAVLLYSFVTSLSAYRRAQPGTPMRARAQAYVVAFGTRDALLLIAILLNIGVVAGMGRTDLEPYVYPIWSFSTVVYIALLAYGILRTQLFDLDLKVKVGIQKGTIVGIVVAAFFIVEKLAENYLSREYGWVVGSIVAGLLVFLAPRLNRLGDKVATTAMPKVEATPAYLQFKKLEVYKAAVEASLGDDGVIDEKARAMLGRLRHKLGLEAHDCDAIEREVAPSAPTGAASA